MPVCVTVTLVDGLVLARSVFNHSVNYRCAMVYGLPELVDDPAEKLAGLEAISEHVVPGQWGYARYPSDKELQRHHRARDWPSTRRRSRSAPGRPTTRRRTCDLDVWAGEVPLRTVRLDPVPAPDLARRASSCPATSPTGPLGPGHGAGAATSADRGRGIGRTGSAAVPAQSMNLASGR